MYKFVAMRILQMIPIILGVIFIVFMIMNLTPGNPGRMILGIAASQESVDKLNEKLGYNQPFFVRFLDYVKDLFLHFDMGDSYESGKPVIREIKAVFPTTLKLVSLGIALYVSIGIPLGVYSAVKQYSVGDNILRVSAICLSAFPMFWLAMLAILVFSLYLGWLPSNGVDTWKHYILPVAVFGISCSAPLMRLTRTIMLEGIRQDFVRTVRAKGAPEKTVIWNHVFKNAMLPLVMTIGIDFGTMLGGVVLLESVFSMPGIGNLALRALRQKDIPVVMGTTIFLAAIFCFMVLVVDVVSAFVDPRVRAKFSQ